MKTRLAWLCLIAALLGCSRTHSGGGPSVSFAGAGLRVDAALVSVPARVGSNDLRITVRDAGGAPVDDAQVDVQYAMTMAGMAPMRGNASVERLGAGVYLARVVLDMSGSWQLALSVARPGGAVARADGVLRVGDESLWLSGTASEGASSEISHYTCPMHPAVHETHPGKCPICGMDLVPVTKAESQSGVVRVEPQRLQKIGVRFALAEQKPLLRRIRALGRVAWDESRRVEVTAKVSGFVRDLQVSAVGARVEKGEPMFSVYSPDLYAAQSELLQAAAAHDRALERAARARLRLWNVAEPELDLLEKRAAPLETLPVRAPASGFVVEKDVVEGSSFAAGAKLLAIAPLDRVWIEAEVYGADLPLVSVGQRARISSDRLSGPPLEARVAAVLPALATDTRAGRIRLELENGNLALRPEMFVDVTLDADLGERLVVPKTAVIVNGERRIVFVDAGGGRLEPRPVELGVAGSDEIEVVTGLRPGERVVASGNFLIAAESRVQSALEQW